MSQFERRLGSRAEVFHGKARQTTGGLRKKDLMKNKHGEIVSRKKHNTAKKEKRLEKHGYFAKKGQFGYVKKTPKGATRKNNKTVKKVRKGKKGRKN